MFVHWWLKYRPDKVVKKMLSLGEPTLKIYIYIYVYSIEFEHCVSAQKVFFTFGLVGVLWKVKPFIKQQYQLFPLPHIGWIGLKSGTGEPVLGYKNCENVSLVVNDYFIG